MNTFKISFEIEECNVEYFQGIAQEVNKEAREYEVPDEDFCFTVENKDEKWIVTVYEDGSEVVLKSGWVSFKGGILDKFAVDYKDAKSGILTQWVE